MLNPEQRARVARRIVSRAGFALVLVLSAAACIFDQGPDYKGGGRRNAGADIQTGTPTDTAPLPTADGSTADTGADSGVTPLGG